MQALSCLPLVVLILASGVPIYAQRSEPILEVREGEPLTVECGLRVEQRVEWRLSGAAPPPDMSPAGERAAGGGGSGGLVARLRTESARPHHGGVYTCSGDGSGEEVRVRVLAARSARPARTDAEGGGAGVETSSAEPATERVLPSGPSVPLKLYMFNIGQPFTLNCTLKHIADGIEYQWKKNGTVVEELSELKGRYAVEKSGAFQLTGRSTEDDFGNYTCGVRGAGDATGWQVHAHPHVKLPSDVNVVEGQKLKLQCRVYGKPYPAVEWRFRNASEANATDVREALGERVRLSRNDQGVEGGELVLEAVRREDAGQYMCVAPAGADESVTVATDSTTLRVKDMYAALWPFLGICAEVFVLCAIILVYEKRRTKPEHDDSDTENHDQKKS